MSMQPLASFIATNLIPGAVGIGATVAGSTVIDCCRSHPINMKRDALAALIGVVALQALLYVTLAIFDPQAATSAGGGFLELARFIGSIALNGGASVIGAIAGVALQRKSNFLDLEGVTQS